MPYKNNKIISSLSANQTKKYGRELAQRILKKGLNNKAFVLALQGELGAGKTTFVQGFAAGLGIKEKISSPSFVIMKKFQFNNLTNSRFSILNLTI